MSKQDRIIIAAVAGIFLVILIVIISSTGDKDSPSQTERPGATTPASSPSVSIDDIYNQVQSGMTPQQVQDIAKRGPDNRSENDFGGTKYENWSFHSGPSFISISFSNGQVSGKSKY